MQIERREDYPNCKELHPLIDEARNQGWRVHLTSNGHLKFLSKDRRTHPVFGPSTPSDGRGVKNLVTKLRHAGLSNV